MAWFNAHAEYAGSIDTSPDQIDRIITLLGSYHPAISLTPDERLDVRISLQAETLRQAVDVTQLVISDALARAGQPDLQPVAVEAMTEELFERREQQPPVPDLVSAQEAADILGVSRQRIQQIADRLGGIKVGSTWVFPRTRVEAERASS